jgi:hypothetical protein
MFEFVCSSCKSQLVAPAEAAGTTMTCPYCQHPEKVPQKVAPLPAAVTAITTPEQIPLSLTAIPNESGANADRQSTEKLDTAAAPDRSVAKKTNRRLPIVALLLLLVAGVGVCATVVVVVITVVIPAVRKSQEAARQAEAKKQTIGNMRKVGLAWYTYEEKIKTAPSPRMNQPALKTGTTGLSWRVDLLPYLDQKPLHDQFDLAKDWNHPRNQPMWEKRPAFYDCPWQPPTNTTTTPFQVFTGPDTLYPSDAKGALSLEEIPDGTANTILFAQAATPVPWTQAADMVLTKTPAHGWQGVYNYGPLPVPQDRFFVVMADATVRMIDRRKINDDVLRQLINPRDGAKLRRTGTSLNDRWHVPAINAPPSSLF